MLGRYSLSDFVSEGVPIELQRNIKLQKILNR